MLGPASLRSGSRRAPPGACPEIRRERTPVHLGADTADRFDEHFAGRLPLSALTAAEAAFLR
ncbi:hypothetical protein AB0N19_38755, partial [Streptomyces sp. NPDC051132]|uniref:hypothetical protein n=1 Tax=Streptomyces sp. NPDC051132 TaxID=3155667 RepID=UPI00343ECD27